MVAWTMETLRSEVNNLRRIVSNRNSTITDLRNENRSLQHKLAAERERSKFFETEKARRDYSSGASQGLSQVSTGTNTKSF